MPRLVVSTATLRCDAGSSLSSLVCLGLGQVESIFHAAGGVTDRVPGVNVFPFGDCKKLKKPCLPLTPDDWAPAGQVVLSGVSALREDAKLGCQEGGEISVVDPGPHPVDVDALRSRFEQQLIERAGEIDPRFLEAFLQQLMLAGVTAVPDGILNAALESMEKLKREGRLSASALKDLERATKGLKAMRWSTKALGSIPEIAQIIEALRKGDVKKAARKAVGLGAGVAVTQGCVAGAAPLAAGGPGAAAAVGIGCTVAGIGAGFGGEALAKHLPLIGD